MYRVVKQFSDLQDHSYVYKAGDVYPREGVTPTEERIAELSSENNKQKRPLIEKIETAAVKVSEPEPTKEVAEVHVDPAKEETEQPKPKVKRRSAKK